MQGKKSGRPNTLSYDRDGFYASLRGIVLEKTSHGLWPLELSSFRNFNKSDPREEPKFYVFNSLI